MTSLKQPSPNTNNTPQRHPATNNAQKIISTNNMDKRTLLKKKQISANQPVVAEKYETAA